MNLKDIRFLHSDESEYISEEPAFLNSEQFPTIKKVLLHYDLIKKEAEEFTSGKIDIEASNPNAPDQNRDNAWKNIYFLNYMLPYKTGRKLFPKTSKILMAQPEITLCGITKLVAGGRLMPHCGETNAIIRCHIGLKIPAGLPAVGIRVKNEERCWQEAEALTFVDAYNHEAWNLTNEDRFVLIFDIMRTEFLPYKKLICAYCLGIASARILLGKTGVYGLSPIWLRKLVAWPLALTWYGVLRLRTFWEVLSAKLREVSITFGS